MRHVVAAGWSGIVGLLVVLVDVTPAAACSPEYREPSEPCTRLRVIVPGESFPLNLAEEIRVTLSIDRGTYVEPAEDFALDPPITVSRETADGYEDVAYTLVDEPDLVPHARALRLETPMPGEYVVAWDAESCSSTPSPDGRGMQVGEFRITEELPLPDDLGTARTSGQELVSQTFSLGIDGACQPVEADAVLARHEIEVELPPAALPWASVMHTAVYVDGELFRGFAPAGASATEDGVVTATIDHICSTDNPSLLDTQPNGLEEGPHEAYLVARLGDLAEIESSAVPFEIDCDDGGGGAAGCSLGGRPDPSGALPFLVVVGALFFPRRR